MLFHILFLPYFHFNVCVFPLMFLFFVPCCLSLPLSVTLLLSLFHFISLSLFLFLFLSLSLSLSLFLSLSLLLVIYFLIFCLVFRPFFHFSFITLSFSFSYCVSGNCCTHKPDSNERTDPANLLSLLLSQQQDNILKTGSTLPRLRTGTLEEGSISLLMELIFYLVVWLVPNLVLTPLQWVQKLNENQIFDSLQLFQLFQNDPSKFTNTQMVFLFHLLGCYGDLHNCTKRPPILAFKKSLRMELSLE